MKTKQDVIDILRSRKDEFLTFIDVALDVDSKIKIVPFDRQLLITTRMVYGRYPGHPGLFSCLSVCVSGGDLQRASPGRNGVPLSPSKWPYSAKLGIDRS